MLFLTALLPLPVTFQPTFHLDVELTLSTADLWVLRQSFATRVAFLANSERQLVGLPRCRPDHFYRPGLHRRGGLVPRGHHPDGAPHPGDGPAPPPPPPQRTEPPRRRDRQDSLEFILPLRPVHLHFSIDHWDLVIGHYSIALLLHCFFGLTLLCPCESLPAPRGGGVLAPGSTGDRLPRRLPC